LGTRLVIQENGGKMCNIGEKIVLRPASDTETGGGSFSAGAGCRNGYSTAIAHGIVLQKAARQICAMMKI